MAAEKKPGLALVIGMGKAKGETGDAEESDEAEESTEFDAAAEELFEACKGDDAEAFKSALKAAIKCC